MVCPYEASTRSADPVSTASLLPSGDQARTPEPSARNRDGFPVCSNDPELAALRGTRVDHEMRRARLPRHPRVASSYEYRQGRPDLVQAPAVDVDLVCVRPAAAVAEKRDVLSVG